MAGVNPSMCPINKHHKLWLDIRIRIRGSSQITRGNACKILPRINHMDQQEFVLLWSFSQGTELLPRARHNKES